MQTLLTRFRLPNRVGENLPVTRKTRSILSCEKRGRDADAFIEHGGARERDDAGGERVRAGHGLLIPSFWFAIKPFLWLR